MAEPIDASNIGQYLAAFADGELDPERGTAVLRFMALSPDLVRRALGQQQLRLAARRVVRARAPGAPDALKRKIGGLAAAHVPPGRGVPGGVPAWRVSGRAALAGAVVSLAVGGLTGWWLHRSARNRHLCRVAPAGAGR